MSVQYLEWQLSDGITFLQTQEDLARLSTRTGKSGELSAAIAERLEEIFCYSRRPEILDEAHHFQAAPIGKSTATGLGETGDMPSQLQ